MAKRHRRLGEILVEWGVVTASAVEEALTHAKREGVRIGEALVALIREGAVQPMEAYLRCHDRKSFIAACHKAGIGFDPREAGQLVTEI